MPIIGHQRIVDYFDQAIAKDSLAHFYILSGPSQIGKSTVLGQVVSRLLNLPGLDLQQPEMLSQRCPDFYYLSLADEKSEITVEQARRLKQKLSLSSLLGGFKVAVIYDADRLNQSSANALLKLFEEPSPRTAIFLLAENSASLLPTIASRAVSLSFQPVPPAAIKEGLAALGADSNDADLLARLCAGRPGWAIEHLNDPEKFATMKARLEGFIGILDKPRHEQFAFLSAALKDEPQSQLYLWQLVLRELMILQAGGKEGLVLPDYRQTLEALAKKIRPQSLAEVIGDIQKLPDEMRFHINQATYLENSFLHL